MLTLRPTTAPRLARGTSACAAVAGPRRTAMAPRASSSAVLVVSGAQLLCGVPLGCEQGSGSLGAVDNGSIAHATMMRHGNRVKHLGRPADQRKALIRGLVTELIRHGQIRTTKVKAKAIRPFAEHMITLAKAGTLHARRQALAFIYDKTLVKQLFEGVQERYGERNGGYTRIKSEPMLRRGDATEMAVIELV